MSITWSDVPRDILERIFKNLKENYFTDFNLRECSLVCRRWSSVAQELIFSNIKLETGDDFEKIIYTVICNPSLSGYIKELNYNCDDKTSYRQRVHLEVIARIFPELEELNSSGFIDDCYYELFCSLIKGGKFPNLKEYPKTWNTYQESLRTSCLISYGKNSISTISLCRCNDTEEKTYILLWNELPHFSKLDTLYISINFCTPQSVVEYIESVTALKIRKLDLSLDFPDNSSSQDQDLKNTKPMRSIITLSNRLRRKLNITHVDYIFYLRDKFPNLESLHLEFSQDNYLHLTILSPIFISQFFMYLSKLIDYSISKCYADANTLCYLIDQFFLTSFTRRRASTNVLHLYCLSDHPISQIEPMTYIHLSQNKKQARKISIELYKEDYNRFCFDILKNVGYHFVELEIDSNNGANFTNFLGHISKYCTNIKSLTIGGKINFMGVNYSNYTYCKNCSLKTLTLRDHFSTELFYFLSIQFPSIEKLIINDQCSRKGDMSRAAIKIDKVFDMLNFSVNHIVIDVRANAFEIYENSFKFVYIQVFTGTKKKKETFHLYDPSSTEKFPKKQSAYVLTKTPRRSIYNRRDQTCLFYEIRCKSVKRISIVNSEGIATEFDVL